MITRNRLLAVGSTAALVAGGTFLSAAPAQAALNSPECLSAQADFRAALDQTGANPELSLELSMALQDVLAAQAELDALNLAASSATVDAQLVLDDALEALATALVNLETAQLSFDAAMGDLVDAGIAVDLATETLDAALLIQAGLIADAESLVSMTLEAQVNADQLVIDTQDDLDAAILGGDLGLIALAQAAADAALLAQADADLAATNAQLALENLLLAETDAVIAARAALEDALTVQVDAQMVVDDLQLVLNDATAVATDAQLSVDEAEVSLAMAANAVGIQVAQDSLDAAIAMLADLQLSAPGISDADITELEGLFAAVIANCGVGDVLLDVDVDVIVDIDGGTGGDGGNGGNTGSGTTGGGSGTSGSGSGGSGSGGSGSGTTGSGSGTAGGGSGGSGTTGGSGSAGSNGGLNIQTGSESDDATAASTSTSASASGPGLLGLTALLVAGGAAAAALVLRLRRGVGSAS